jgi:hypothetical protein
MGAVAGCKPPLRTRLLTGALAVGLAISCFPAQTWAKKDKSEVNLARMDLVRGIVAEFGLARFRVPRWDKPIVISVPTDTVTNLGELNQAVTNNGAIANPGDRLEITKLAIKGNRLLLDLNGGLGLKGHWYDHLEIGMGTIATPISNPYGRVVGSQVVLKFKHGVPSDLTAAEVKQLLRPVIDWDIHKAAVVNLAKLPAPVANAIKSHQVLVGMDTDMVLASMGRSERKVREADPKTGDEYEDWIYGHPPSDTTFVRIEDDRVVRVAVYKADGTTVVRTQPEIQVAKAPAQAVASAGSANGGGDAGGPAPTLRRPGEEVGTADQRTNNGGMVTVPMSPGAPAPGTTVPIGGSSAPGPIDPSGQPMPTGEPPL